MFRFTYLLTYLFRTDWASIYIRRTYSKLSRLFDIQLIDFLDFVNCRLYWRLLEYQRGLAMRKVSVRLSVCSYVCQTSGL